MKVVENIIKENIFTKERIIDLLKADTEQSKYIFEEAARIKSIYIGNKVHLRGLIELTNKCSKNCFYCGIAVSNHNVNRYCVSLGEVEKAIKFIDRNNYGSIVIQSGELQSEEFISYIEKILHKIVELSWGRLGVTLSCGEQSEETYQRWKEAGAHRYLLRIETSNEKHYYKLHPKNAKHNFHKRLKSLEYLKKCGYQTGTGVMIASPFQTIENLAEDLLFMKHIDIDMCGMGPYIEHEDSPLFNSKESFYNTTEKIQLSLKMIALLRIIMKDINIAATTAMQTLATGGREMALKAGANILMPNVTPGKYREQYELYKNKPGLDEEAEDSKISMEKIISKANSIPAYGEKGNSNHFKNRMKSSYIY
ncbi:MAG: [FeFe] hydrogenase H-cluster radical SAM maturase HydE [Marinilabiliales bacterium]|nr:MAG: [FeFe] hydrogenase H-cluster radical SAM maturase HydE [Marinilabiliales bacterium]